MAILKNRTTTKLLKANTPVTQKLGPFFKQMSTQLNTLVVTGNFSLISSPMTFKHVVLSVIQAYNISTISNNMNF